MAEAVACRDVGNIFRLLNKRHHMTQHRIAELAGLADSEIFSITRGRQVMAYDVLVRIAEGLGIPRGLMGLAYDDEKALNPVPASPLPSLEDSASSQRFVATLAGFAVGGAPVIDEWLPIVEEWPGQIPNVVTPAIVATVRDITDRHRRMDSQYGGGSCRDSTLGYLGWAQCLLRSRCPSDALLAELRRALADLHNLVGWMSHDLGEQNSARRHLAQGLALATTAGDHTLMADSYYRLGRVSIHRDNPVEALHLFQLGQIVAANSGCLTSVAILHANIGWAYAKIGNATAVRDSLSRAADELSRADVAAAPEWTRFFLGADLDGMSGVVYAALAQHEEYRQEHAELATERAIAALSRRGPLCRSSAFDHVTAAMGFALLRQRRAAVPHVAAALEAANAKVHSRRLVDRLNDVADVADVADGQGKDDELGELVHEIRILANA
ncbi:helix-turn-helix transcriptional regulator [Paractinoplanes toevensis]|uniref:XRE family transcriptional regulator n=1 Tax=Paractinoplanes toevensis TaxID=571911 RepID=A0A919TI96_9ACTN|nr:helix-turn-helix transcriptional regulator [Actinoplanes toevensis]GIM94406.1 XRE family transcriptional regulator [Actinoplanes toevensis]